MPTALMFLSGVAQLPPTTLALLVSLSAIALAAFTIHVVSKHRGGGR